MRVSDIVSDIGNDQMCVSAIGNDQMSLKIAPNAR